MRPVERLLPDVARFAQLAISSTDLDPTYPVLRSVQRARGLSPDEALWSSVWFVGYYRLASALQVDGRVSGRLLKLGTGVERRSLRTPVKMARHFGSVFDHAEHHGSLRLWLTNGFGKDPYVNWTRLRENYGQAWGNGRWATYKLAEVLKEVNDFNLEAPDMGHDGSTGPVSGLHLLYGRPHPAPKQDLLRRYDAQGIDLKVRLETHGVTGLNLARVETVLCDFHNLANGGYYVGHDIDVMQADLARPEVPDWVRHELLAARRVSTPHAYLGELRGWLGPDKHRRKHYAATGEVLGR